MKMPMTHEDASWGRRVQRESWVRNSSSSFNSNKCLFLLACAAEFAHFIQIIHDYIRTQIHVYMCWCMCMSIHKHIHQHFIHIHIHNGDDDDSDGRTRNSTLRAAAAVYALIALENVTLPTKLAKLSDNLTPFFKKTNNYILPNYLTI